MLHLAPKHKTMVQMTDMKHPTWSPRFSINFICQMILYHKCIWSPLYLSWLYLACNHQIWVESAVINEPSSLLLYNNDFTSIIGIYFYESFSAPNLK